MSDISEIRRKVDGLQESLAELNNSVRTRKCAGKSCRCTLSRDDKVFCEDCAKSPECHDCSNEIDGGYCSACARAGVHAARSVAVGFYPHLGLPRTGPAPEQLLSFLRTLVDTCCKLESNPCARCADAQHLYTLYSESLGEVRA